MEDAQTLEKPEFIINGTNLRTSYLVFNDDFRKISWDSKQVNILAYSSDKIFEVYLALPSKDKKKKKIQKTYTPDLLPVNQYIHKEISNLNSDLSFKCKKKLEDSICKFVRKKALRDLYRKSKKKVFSDVLTNRREIEGTTHPTVMRMAVNAIENMSLDHFDTLLPGFKSQSKLLFQLSRKLSKKRKIFIEAASKSSALEYALCYELKKVIKDEKDHYLKELTNVLKHLKRVCPDLFRDLPYLDEKNLRKAIERGKPLFESEKTIKSPPLKNYDNLHFFKIEDWGISILRRLS